MRRTFVFATLVILIAGCKSEPPPPPEPVAPPPPSAGEVLNELKNATQPLWDAHNRNLGIKDAQRAEVLSAFRSTRGRHSANPNLGEAMRKYRGDLEDLLKAARESDRWRLIKGICEVLREADAANFRHEKLEHKADLILARPIVNVRGFMEVDGEQNVFFIVRDRDTNKESSYQIREGEEFHEVFRLIRIIGDKEACEILYKPIEDPYIVQGPSALRSQSIYE